MRIPFPERVPIGRAALFAMALFIVQWLEGTTLFFRFGCAVFILIAAFAFNTAGGLTRASGAYVFFYSVLVVIIGVCYKAFLGEPGQSNLLDPRTTIKVYVGGITAMLAAVIVSNRFRRKSGLLQNLLTESQMYRASVGCITFGIAGASIIALLGESAGGLNSAFTQLNELIPLGIIIGVMYEIRRSGGTRSINMPILLGIGYSFLFYGLFGFSKQGMLLPVVSWFFPVCALRFRMSVLQVCSVLVCVFILFYYLVPFAQYGRAEAAEASSLSERAVIALDLIQHPGETRQHYEEIQAQFTAGTMGEYYNTAQGFWDRLQFVSVDDTLINITDEGKVVGFAPITESIINVVPHFIWPGKPRPIFGGNYYAHEIGGIPEEDTTTGISFSPTAEAYHIAKWVGVLVVAPLLWFLFFVTFDSLFGDLRATPWGLLVVALISHTAPEGALTGLIYLLTFGLEIVVFCALFATYVAPVIASSVLGPERHRAARRLSFPAVPAPGKTTDEPA